MIRILSQLRTVGPNQVPVHIEVSEVHALSQCHQHPVMIIAFRQKSPSYFTAGLISVCHYRLSMQAGTDVSASS